MATAEAIHGEGGVYVAGLLRPGDVPAGWQMDRAPQYVARSPEPGEMYSFACDQLPARSTGVATVGYRSLEGLPSLTVEYVIYATAEDAAAALAEMRATAESCGTFTVTAAGGEVSARMTPLDFPAGGDASFAVALETASAATGDLLTHVIKDPAGAGDHRHQPRRARRRPAARPGGQRARRRTDGPLSEPDRVGGAAAQRRFLLGCCCCCGWRRSDSSRRIETYIQIMDSIRP